ncbi:extracellular calcium-sensing receptor-like [Acipenser ruthenus]|uniref:extracellular calcium-sensing receptor-like n=1 Tax=Acipenser ruthenus TaxID=7906 RepID=UPI002741939C|nr:extracellular calcium-sensing receptor-like [Acipenser ruthenus]
MAQVTAMQLLLILALFSPGTMTEAACTLQGNFKLPALLADGDIIIGGLFPMHYRVLVPELNYTYKPAASACQGFDSRSFRWAQTMRLAIKEINENPNLLPNITLGYKIYDSCATHVAALRATLSVLNGPKEVSSMMCSGASPVKAIIGDSGSSQSIIVSRTLQPFKIPMISYIATCSCLSKRNEYPNFFRTVPNDNYQVKAIAQLVKHFGWAWVGAVSEEGDYGRYAFQALIEEFKKIGVCLAYYEVIPKVYSRKKILEILDIMKKSSAKVVISFAGEGDLYPLLTEYVQQNITGIQWIASEAWITASLFSPREFYPSLGGTIGFAIRRGEIPGLKDFLLKVHPSLYPDNALVKELWSTMFGCTFQPSNTTDQSGRGLPLCTGHESLEEKYSVYTDVSSPRISYNVYKAVYAVAHSLHNLLNCEPGKGPFDNFTCADISNIEPYQLQHYIQKVSFTNSLGEKISFDENGDPIASYDVMNWQRGADGKIWFVTVGLYDTSEGAGNELVINEEAIIWNSDQTKVPSSVCTESCPPGTRKGVRRGEPLCCFDCLPCADGEISNQTDSIECIQCPVDFWSNAERTECIPKEIEYLTYDEMGVTLTVIALFGACLTIGVLAVFLHYKNTPMVRVNNSELSFFILLSLALCFLSSIAFIGEPANWSCMFRHTVFSITFSLCISCILGKTVVVLMAFKATQPGSNIMKWFGPIQQRIMISACTSVQIIICAIWLIAMPPFPSKNTKYQSSKIILECDVGSTLAFWCVLGYIGVLACMCFVLAFLARKLPGNFNEAKYITFSMLIFCAVWIAFIPAYVSSPGKYTVAVEIFAILSSSFGLLFCIFAPKCYIILLKPQKNTKQYIMGKASANTSNKT